MVETASSFCKGFCLQAGVCSRSLAALQRTAATGAHGQWGALPDVPDDARLQGEVCVPCGRCFDTRQAWAVHAFKVHGRVRQERTLVDGSACPICLRTFASNVRLCRHVQHTPRCKDMLLRGGFSVAAGPGVGSRQSRGEADFLMPAMQGLGLFKEECYTFGPNTGTPREEFCSDTLLDLQELATKERPEWGLRDLIEASRVVLGSRCLSAACLAGTVRVWQETLEADHCESLSLRWSALVRACGEWVCSNLSFHWLCQGTAAAKPQTVHTFAHSEAALSWLDFALVEKRDMQPPCGQGGFLLCHKSWLKAFQDRDSSWDVCCDLTEAVQNSAWQNKGEALLCEGRHGLFCLSLLGLRWEEVEVHPPVKAKAARRATDLIHLFRDVVCFCLRLWELQRPFVMVLPNRSEAHMHNLLALPGIDGFRSEAWQVVHSVVQEGIPEFLFHRI